MAYISFKPTNFFDTKLFTGNGSALTVSGGSFQSDFTWIKCRSNTEYHNLTNSPRGVTKNLSCNVNSAEATYAGATGRITAFNGTGFTLGSNDQTNLNSGTFAAWNWKAGTTSGITTNGSTTITPSAYSFSTTSGVSILSYTGNVTSGAKLAHGLGTAPKFWIIKNCSNTEDFTCYHSALGPTKFMTFNTAASAGTATNRWNDTDPDSVNITLGSEGSVNGTGTDNMLCYAFSEVPGFSKFTQYLGNGSTDGSPVINCGFQPAFLMIKEADSGSGWCMWDNKRPDSNPGYWNPNSNFFQANDTGVESNNTNLSIDITATGFKIANSAGDTNGSGNHYLVMAWAENPIIGSGGTVGLAR